MDETNSTIEATKPASIDRFERTSFERLGRLLSAIGGGAIVAAIGCGESSPKGGLGGAIDAAIGAEAPKKPEKRINPFERVSPDIKPADKNAQVVENPHRPKNEAEGELITSPIQAGQSALVKLDKAIVQNSLETFRAINGRYPKSHAEFMEKIVGEMELKLQKLPEGYEYQYKVAEHELTIVKKD